MDWKLRCGAPKNVGKHVGRRTFQKRMLLVRIEWTYTVMGLICWLAGNLIDAWKFYEILVGMTRQWEHGGIFAVWDFQCVYWSTHTRMGEHSTWSLVGVVTGQFMLFFSTTDAAPWLVHGPMSELHLPMSQNFGFVWKSDSRCLFSPSRLPFGGIPQFQADWNRFEVFSTATLVHRKMWSHHEQCHRMSQMLAGFFLAGKCRWIHE